MGSNRPIALVAMGGHAFIQPDERGTIEDHESNAKSIAKVLMTLVDRDYRLVITHGNGPQVGHLLLQNETAKSESPPMPLDVLVAMTPGTGSATWRGTVPAQTSLAGVSVFVQGIAFQAGGANSAGAALRAGGEVVVGMR